MKTVILDQFIGFLSAALTILAWLAGEKLTDKVERFIGYSHRFFLIGAINIPVYIVAFGLISISSIFAYLVVYVLLAFSIGFRYDHNLVSILSFPAYLFTATYVSHGIASAIKKLSNKYEIIRVPLALKPVQDEKSYFYSWLIMGLMPLTVLIYSIISFFNIVLLVLAYFFHLLNKLKDSSDFFRNRGGFATLCLILAIISLYFAYSN